MNDYRLCSEKKKLRIFHCQVELREGSLLLPSSKPNMAGKFVSRRGKSSMQLSDFPFSEMGVSENSVPHCTQWFCWSLSLLNGYFVGKINPTFSDKPRSVQSIPEKKQPLTIQSKRCILDPNDTDANPFKDFCRLNPVVIQWLKT